VATEKNPLNKTFNLSGKILVAMPFLADIRFSQTVIYVCGHDEQGAMGLIINKGMPGVEFTELLEQVEGGFSGTQNTGVPIQYGGPVDLGRGFVLHSRDYITDSTVLIENGCAMTATLDILRAVALDKGPHKALLALGYVSWDAGQLENEIQENGWLTIDGDPEIIFSHDLENKWRFAYATLGIDPSGMSLESGHA
jgi:putative transcriptional regulator